MLERDEAAIIWRLEIFGDCAAGARAHMVCALCPDWTASQSPNLSLLGTSFLVLAAALDEQKMHGAVWHGWGKSSHYSAFKASITCRFTLCAASCMFKGKEHA